MMNNSQNPNVYPNVQLFEVPPRADVMIETFRSIGYNIQTAIADLIDNSISAGANNVWIDFEWDGDNSTVRIADDGMGMDKDELVEAMRPGSKNPSDERDLKDLGRFGLGLKTASFSQCRKFTVASKTSDSDIDYWTWDLDYIKQVQTWCLVKLPPDKIFLNILENMKNGTIVIWEKTDRLFKGFKKDSEDNKKKFFEIIEKAEKHLSMFFHRYIENRELKIFFNQREIESWDPFLKSKNPQVIEDSLQEGTITIKGYVLPHKSRLNEMEHKKAEGIRGWTAQQGFYIYRNKRLLVCGDWLGMFKQEEHYKLARISINLPNKYDDLWQLDIKKSIIIIPQHLKDSLKSIANKVRNNAVEVFRHKGKIVQRKYPQLQFQPIWQERIKHGKRFYQINEEHPIIKELIDKIGGQTKHINQLFSFIEQTIPIDLITIRQSEDPDKQGTAFESEQHETMKNLIKEMYSTLLGKGKTDKQAKGFILSIEPFNLYPEYTELLNI